MIVLILIDLKNIYYLIVKFKFEWDMNLTNSKFKILILFIIFRPIKIKVNLY